MSVTFCTILSNKEKHLSTYSNPERPAPNQSGLSALLRKVPPGREYTPLRSKRNSAFSFHVLVAEELFVVAQCDAEVGNSSGVETLLRTIIFCFSAQFGKGTPKESNAFESELRTIIESYNKKLEQEENRLRTINHEMSDVNKYIAQNIKTAIDRGQTLQEMKERSDFLDKKAEMFQKKAKQVRDETGTYNFCVYGLGFVFILLLVLLVFYLFIRLFK